MSWLAFILGLVLGIADIAYKNYKIKHETPAQRAARLRREREKELRKMIEEEAMMMAIAMDVWND